MGGGCAPVPKPLDLKLVDRFELGSGAVAVRYEPGTRPPACAAPVVAPRDAAL